jgi:ubiquinone/menaquinone biosynthesis C-methylase UbiE
MNFEYDYRPDSPGERNWHEEDDPWKAKNIHKILGKNDINPKSICEIGYGAGGLLQNLAAYYKNDVTFHGYETSEAAYNISKPKEKENIHYYFQDLLKEDAYYDVVMAINVFTHVRDYLGFLSQLRKKGEYKVFHISLQITLYTVIRSQYFQSKDYMRSQLHYFNKDTALGTLKGTGYEIIDYFYTSRALDMPNPQGKEKFWKTPRKILRSINEDLAAKLLGGFSLMVLAK